VKLIVSISPDSDANHLIDSLMAHDFRATRINSSGGFLKRGNATVVIGVEDDRVEEVVRLVQESAEHANVYVLNVARHERL
jgi:uncharacterized protein YaaQ